MEENLWEACFDGKVEEAQRLLQNEQININWQDYFGATPFHSACYNGHTEIVKLLLNDERIDINKANEHGSTPFHHVCEKGHLEIVKLLLNDQRIDLNKSMDSGFTPFYIACQKGYIDIVEYLLVCGREIDFNKADNDGATPFHTSCKKGYLEIVKLLLNDKRVDIKKATNNGYISFHRACYNGHIEIVKLLLNDERVNVNRTENGGETSFYIACEKGHIEIMKLLLNDKRISIRKKTNKRKTAFDIAKTNNHLEIMDLIKEVDTGQRYSEYLETLQNSPFFCIENEIINKQDFLVLSEHLKNNKNIKELRLINCDLTPSNILEILKTLIWKYENFQLRNIQNIEIDEIELESTEGLEIIPIEIRNQGTKSIVQYILDLSTSPNSNPLYRTKLMVVGFENVGKTTILDCLFPIIDLGETKGIFNFLSTEYLFELQGKCLRKYKPKELNKVYKEIILENKQWSVQEIKETGLELIPLNDKNQKELEIYFKDQETRDKWIERLKRVIINSATHGIEVNTHIWNSSTFNQLQKKNLEAKQNGNGNQENKEKNDDVEYSSWDFAGQNDYYNTHHYFLSNRSIFLVLYRMDKGIKGLESLDFWLKSLSSHLNQNYCDENGKPFYSIFIIGTFLDSIVNNNQNDEDKNLRQIKVMEIYNRNGLKSPPFYFEVSCSTLENIDELREIIFNVSLSHSYMGENVPIGYLTIEKSIYELRKLKQNHPIIEIKDLIDYVQSQYQSSFEFDIEFTKRGLRLLHEWGICIYFENPIELSNIIVLDPQHLTKTILGDLFKADESIRQLRSNGIIDYSQLNNIWNGPMNLIDIYLSLLEKFEVCFILEDQLIGNEKKLIIPNLLPDPEMIKETKVKNLELMKELGKLENSTSNQTTKEKIQQENQRITSMEYEINLIKNKLEKKWPRTIPLEAIEIERIFSFNQVPSEMVSRLLVRFHDKIVDNIIWRRGVLLKHVHNENENENVLCLLEVKMSENLFEIRIRGKERKKCLEMMKYIYEEVKIVSGNYGGVKWKECVRSPHFSKGLINLDDIHQDCKLELKDRKLICPITHFPIYGEDLLFKTGLLDTLDPQDNFGNDYWSFTYQNQNQKKESQKKENQINTTSKIKIFGNNVWKFLHQPQNQNQSQNQDPPQNQDQPQNQNQNQKNEKKTIFENSEVFEDELFKGLKKILEVLGFDLSKVEKVIGNENINLKNIFKGRCEQIFKNRKDDPIRYKNENWFEGKDIELRKSMIQYLGDYISKFKQFGWNYGNNAFVIPMIQGTSEEAAQRICNNGFSAVPKNVNDLGYFSLGVYTTSKEKYARKYCNENKNVFVIGLMIVGNPFPVIEHPFVTDKEGKNVMEKQEQKDSNGMDVYKRKINENGYFGKPINLGYDSHITLVNGNSTATAYPITKVEQLNQGWTVDELVVNESQTYPCYIVYYK